MNPLLLEGGIVEGANTFFTILSSTLSSPLGLFIYACLGGALAAFAFKTFTR